MAYAMLLSLPRLFMLLVAALAVGTSLPASSSKAQSPDKSGPSPAVPLKKAQGSLPPPVVGEQIVAFGQPTADGPSPEIVIKTRPGATVVAPCAGTVVYVGEFRSYRNLVIIDAGGGHHVLLGGLWLVNLKLGQRVSPGEPIGTLPRSTADGAAPTLRVELRKDGRPIDPAPWWGKG